VKWCVALLVLAACRPNESEVARHRQARDSLLTTEVVKALVTPTSTGRLIYEPPVDLSYDSLRLKRPDLVRAADRRK
jgi:hypothetical protein